MALDEPNTSNINVIPDNDLNGSCVENLDGDNSKESTVEILDCYSDTEVCETELVQFSKTLCDAQKKAKEEKGTRAKKRKTYNGSSQATACHQKHLWRDLTIKGFLSVFEFIEHMALQKDAEKLTTLQNLTVESEETSKDNNNNNNNDDNDVVATVWSNQPCNICFYDSGDTEIEGSTPAASEEHCCVNCVAQGATSINKHHQVWVVQGLPEKEEESTESEDEEGKYIGAATFKKIWHQVLTASMMPSRAAILADVTPAFTAFLCDRLRLRAACAKLVMEFSNKNLDHITRQQIQGMMGLLNLHLDDDLSLSWKKTSVIVSKAQGRGDTHTRCICEWTGEFLPSGALPLHCLGQAQWTVLSDEDITSKIKLKMVEKTKKGFLKGEDLVELVASPEMQNVFSKKGISKLLISNKTATHWLKKLD